jgi:hypothetical protein
MSADEFGCDNVFPVIAMTLLEASNRSIDYRSRLSMFY